MKRRSAIGAKKRKVRRERFADGSALVTYPDGSMLILESDLARESVLQEGSTVNYGEPAPNLRNGGEARGGFFSRKAQPAGRDDDGTNPSTEQRVASRQPPKITNASLSEPERKVAGW